MYHYVLVPQVNDEFFFNLQLVLLVFIVSPAGKGREDQYLVTCEREMNACMYTRLPLYGRIQMDVCHSRIALLLIRMATCKMRTPRVDLHGLYIIAQGLSYRVSSRTLVHNTRTRTLHVRVHMRLVQQKEKKHTRYMYPSACLCLSPCIHHLLITALRSPNFHFFFFLPRISCTATTNGNKEAPISINKFDQCN
jgi:hypothetical protein